MKDSEIDRRLLLYAACLLLASRETWPGVRQTLRHRHLQICVYRGLYAVCVGTYYVHSAV